MLQHSSNKVLSILKRKVSVVFHSKRQKCLLRHSQKFQAISLSSFLLKTLENIRITIDKSTISGTQNTYLNGKSFESALHEHGIYAYGFLIHKGESLEGLLVSDFLVGWIDNMLGAKLSTQGIQVVSRQKNARGEFYLSSCGFIAGEKASRTQWVINA